ncbi:hypothetical protein XENOCAPTIV_004047 [Xenoophorus captivus]|uniref:Uncharacterized protein n=1 Tax=Xenoophorus captivus TaxID=1517983 RepID=A0ABV0RYL6_9TELE
MPMPRTIPSVHALPNEPHRALKKGFILQRFMKARFVECITNSRRWISAAPPGGLWSYWLPSLINARLSQHVGSGGRPCVGRCAVDFAVFCEMFIAGDIVL